VLVSDPLDGFRLNARGVVMLDVAAPSCNQSLDLAAHGYEDRTLEVLDQMVPMGPTLIGREVTLGWRAALMVTRGAVPNQLESGCAKKARKGQFPRRCSGDESPSLSDCFGETSRMR
jgi:hypothetical protein